jgi:hypothetical protein
VAVRRGRPVERRATVAETPTSPPPVVAPDLVKKRIELLSKFNAALSRWITGAKDHDPRSAYLRSYGQAAPQAQRERDRKFINRNMYAVRAALNQVGISATIEVSPPPMLGGAAFRVDPLTGNIFRHFYRQSVIPDVMQSVEQAIGIYEHLRDGTGLVEISSRKTIDLLGAIERSLRPFFGSNAPTREIQVQDAIEVVLNSLGIRYSRDKETAAVGPRGFRPDFSLTEEETALEVKLTKEGHGASAVQEEISADIAGYSTCWSRLIVVIYDVGAIANPKEMERENMKHFGVTVLVVKH